MIRELICSWLGHKFVRRECIGLDANWDNIYEWKETKRCARCGKRKEK